MGNDLQGSIGVVGVCQDANANGPEVVCEQVEKREVGKSKEKREKEY